MLYGICTYINSHKNQPSVRPMDPSGVLSKSRGNDETVTHDICLNHFEKGAMQRNPMHSGQVSAGPRAGLEAGHLGRTQ